VGRLDELAMHPTVKPVALVSEAIKDCSRRNGLVLDPFAGSGTVVIAAERTGRRARALEIDPHYVDVAVKRWQAYTGSNEAARQEAIKAARAIERCRTPSRRLSGRQAWSAQKVTNVPNEFVSPEGTNADTEIKSPSAETEEADGDVLLLDDEDGNPTEIIGADIEKDDT